MKIFKFVIHGHEWISAPGKSNVQYSGCVAACIAESVDDAREVLRRYAAEMGFDAAWLDVARVIELPVQTGVTVAWAQV